MRPPPICAWGGLAAAGEIACRCDDGICELGRARRERDRQVALDGLILRGLVGSTVHGLSNPGTDDRDAMGVCVEPPEYVIGLRNFEHYVSRTKPAQRRSLLGERHATRARELSSEHGYDTKYAMHALRIAMQGIELLSTGGISLPVPEPDRARLRAIRAGSVPLDEAVGQLDELTARLERVTAQSDLPAAGDGARVDRLLVEAYREAWG